MSERIDLAGVYVPVVTPFDETTGGIDLAGHRTNLQQWFETSIRGVLVAGSSGESVYLDDAEVEALILSARSVAPEGRLVLAGTGAESTRATIRRTRTAADLGADAVLVKPPVYFRGAMTREALLAHYAAVAEASPIPVIVYQVPPKLATLEFETEWMARLSEHPNIVGVKDSRGNVDLLAEWVAACDADFQVLVGSGAALLPALERGAVGGILGLANMAPAECVEIHAAYVGGERERAADLQERVAPVHVGVVAAMGPAGMKRALDLLGMRGGSPRPPMLPVSAEREAEIARLLSEARIAGALVDTPPGAA